MAAKDDIPARDPPLPEEETDHKLLLDILANQKSANEKQEKRYCDWDNSITATKKLLDKHIEENHKSLTAIKGNVTSLHKCKGLDEASPNLESFCCYNLQVRH